MEIHPYGTPHHLIHHKNFVSLEPGTFTFIELEQIETYLLKPPFSPGMKYIWGHSKSMSLRKSQFLVGSDIDHVTLSQVLAFTSLLLRRVINFFE